MNQSKPETIQLVDEASSSLSNIKSGEVIIGTLVEFDQQGQPCVDFSENSSKHILVAVSTLNLTQQHIGRQVALLFANGDIHQPIIMGLIHSPLQEMLDSFDPSQTDHKTHVEIDAELKVEDVQIDGHKLIFEAKEEIVFKCGDSSITLNKSGKISIRGKHLSSRSTGVNQIMGGSVKVN